MKNPLQSLREFPFRFLFFHSGARQLIETSLRQYARMSDPSLASLPIEKQVDWLLSKNDVQDFWSLFYLRVGKISGPPNRFLLSLAKHWFKPLRTLTVKCPDMAPGLVIKHGYGTLIEAKQIGQSCLIFHDVTIGSECGKCDLPVLGNYVHISSGARVLGSVIIGDHAVIAANAVVTMDVPPNSLAVGVPARIIENAGNKAQYIESGIVPA